MPPLSLKSLRVALKGSSSTKTADEPAENGAAEGDPAQALEAPLHPDAHEEGGLLCNNEALLKEQREAIMEWIKSMGKKLFTGSFNLINTPFPVIMFEPRSYLEKLADVWVYPHYLQRAGRNSDPVERMKLVVTWFIAGLHHSFEKWKKPFNPILGETWEAGLPDGSSIFMEQISHHPPVSAFHLEGPGGSYRFRGLSQPHVSLMIKQYGFKTVAKGYRYVEFADGSRIEMHYPGYYVRGVVYSSRPRAEVEGEAVFLDARNQLKAVVKFGAVKSAKSPMLRRTDAVTGGVYDMRGAFSPGAISQGNTGQRPGSAAPMDLSPSTSSDASDAYESASETEFDLRELRAAAEGLPGSEQGVQNGYGTASCGRAASGAAPVAGSQQGAWQAPGAGQGAVSNHVQGHREPPTPLRVSTDGNRASQPGQLPTPGSRTRLSECGTGLGGGPAPQMSGSSGSKTRTDHSGSLFSGFSKMIGFSANNSASGQGGGVEDPSAEGGVLLTTLEGSWLSHLNIDGQRYWTLATERPATWVPVRDALPSDSRYRQDLAELKAGGDVRMAQRWKEALEDAQRRDKKLREAGGLHIGSGRH